MLGQVADRPAALQLVSAPDAPQGLMVLFDVPELDVGEVSEDPLMLCSDPAVVRVGVPGGSGVMRTRDPRCGAVARRPWSGVAPSPTLVPPMTGGRSWSPSASSAPASTSLGEASALLSIEGIDVALSIEVTDAGPPRCCGRGPLVKRRRRRAVLTVEGARAARCRHDARAGRKRLAKRAPATATAAATRAPALKPEKKASLTWPRYGCALAPSSPAIVPRCADRLLGQLLHVGGELLDHGVAVLEDVDVRRAEHAANDGDAQRARELAGGVVDC